MEAAQLENELFDIFIIPVTQIKELRPERLPFPPQVPAWPDQRAPRISGGGGRTAVRLPRARGPAPPETRSPGLGALLGPAPRPGLPAGGGLCGGCRAGGGGSGGRQQGDSHTSLFCKLFLTACLFRVRAGAAPYGSVTHCLMWQLISRALLLPLISLLSLIGEPGGAWLPANERRVPRLHWPLPPGSPRGTLQARGHGSRAHQVQIPARPGGASSGQAPVHSFALSLRFPSRSGGSRAASSGWLRGVVIT